MDKSEKQSQPVDPAEELAQKMLKLPADYKWKYLEKSKEKSAPKRAQ